MPDATFCGSHCGAPQKDMWQFCLASDYTFRICFRPGILIFFLFCLFVLFAGFQGRSSPVWCSLGQAGAWAPALGLTSVPVPPPVSWCRTTRALCSPGRASCPPPTRCLPRQWKPVSNWLAAGGRGLSAFFFSCKIRKLSQIPCCSKILGFCLFSGQK